MHLAGFRCDAYARVKKPLGQGVGARATRRRRPLFHPSHRVPEDDVGIGRVRGEARDVALVGEDHRRIHSENRRCGIVQDNLCLHPQLMRRLAVRRLQRPGVERS